MHTPSKFCVAQMCTFSPPYFLRRTLGELYWELGLLFMQLLIALIMANLTDILFCGWPAQHRSNSALVFVNKKPSDLNFLQPPSVYGDAGPARSTEAVARADTMFSEYL